MSAPATMPAAETLAALLRAIGQPQRLAILTALADGERGVAALESAAGIAQPALSQQLAVLRKAGLVTARRQAREVFYALDEGRLALAHEALGRLRGSPAATPHSPPPAFAPGRASVGAALFAQVAPRA